MPASLDIVFHGANAATFAEGFDTLVPAGCRVRTLSDRLDGDGEREAYAAADVVVAIRLVDHLPRPAKVRLFHAPATGIDAIDTSLLPPGATLCNCFGHETAIAEFVMTAMLLQHVPIPEADAELKANRWTWWAGRSTATLRSELADQTVGLLGFGHIGRAVASRAKAFGMKVVVANRSPVPASAVVDASMTLDRLHAFLGAVDWVVCSLPLTPETEGLIDAAALAAMRPTGMILNVGRGPVISEQALYDALAAGRIGGAVIDTWYQYPSASEPNRPPSRLDFASLPNVVMSPHMSGWTTGTVRRRQQTMAANVRRLLAGEPLENVVFHA